MTIRTLQHHHVTHTFYILMGKLIYGEVRLQHTTGSRHNCYRRCWWYRRNWWTRWIRRSGNSSASNRSIWLSNTGCRSTSFTTTAPPNNSTHPNSTLLKYTGTNRYMTMTVDPLTKDGINLNFYLPELYLEKVFSNGVRENTDGLVNIKVCLTSSPCGTEAVIAEQTFSFSGNTTTPQNQQRFFQWSQSENFQTYSKSFLFPSNTATLYI